MPTADLLVDDIRPEYHPCSGRQAEVCHFKDYIRSSHPTSQDPPSSTPWAPYFKMCENFELAELIHDASLNKDQCERLIKIIQSCANGQGLFTMKTYADLERAWNRASQTLTSVCTK